MLFTWHCLYLPTAAAAIDQYLLPARPTAANLQQWVCYCGTLHHFLDPALHTMLAVLTKLAQAATKLIHCIQEKRSH